jgi:predicted RNase H-like HicB family nuclease
MDEKLMAEAKSLAGKGYTITIQLDHTSDGEDIYFAQCEELDGCMAQGKTPDKAIQNMIIAIEDYIYFLLVDEMPVPKPSQFQTMGVEGSVSKEVNVFEGNSEFVTIRTKCNERFVDRLDQIELHSSFVTAYET